MSNTSNDTLKSGKMLYCFLKTVLPVVNQEINKWHDFALSNMEGELQIQALASIHSKKFHCQGGNFYSIYPEVNTPEFITFIVALQTISDYLDNLCDRASVLDETAFRQLHYAMTDALDPTATHKNYYAFYPYQKDGGYLDTLVTTCQNILKKLPGYDLVKKDILQLAILYSQLQTYKHIDLELREAAMLAWLTKTNTHPTLTNWEYAAATGSTLGMFMLAAAAYQKNLTPEHVTAIKNSYFPWICGLHIQLDYFIDQEEDTQNNDLNFIFYYKNEQETASRLRLFYNQALQHAQKTQHSFFAKTIVQGLIALYLSDPKIKTPTQQYVKRELLHHAGIHTNLLYRLCKFLREKNII